MNLPIPSEQWCEKPDNNEMNILGIESMLGLGVGFEAWYLLDHDLLLEHRVLPEDKRRL